MLKSKSDSKSSSSASRSSSKLRDSKKKDALPAPIDEATGRQQRDELQEVASRANSQAESTPRSGNSDASRATSSDEEWLDQMTQIGVAPMIAKAHIKHRHDMPDLMRNHSYGWVAYQGD